MVVRRIKVVLGPEKEASFTLPFRAGSLLVTMATEDHGLVSLAGSIVFTWQIDAS